MFRFAHKLSYKLYNFQILLLFYDFKAHQRLWWSDISYKQLCVVYVAILSTVQSPVGPLERLQMFFFRDFSLSIVENPLHTPNDMYVAPTIPLFGHLYSIHHLLDYHVCSFDRFYTHFGYALSTFNRN